MKLTQRPLLSFPRTCALLALAVMSPAADAVEQYTVYRVGLYDSSTTAGSHQGLNGPNDSFNFFAANGAAVGSATRYVSSTSTSTVGADIWYYNPTTHLTTTIGLTAPYSTTAPSNTESDGLEYNLAQFMSSTGYAAGKAYVYSSVPGTGGSSSLGQQAWVYSPSNGTIAVGLYDAQPSGTASHTNSAGLVSATLIGLNNAGQAIGYSNRYDGTATEGQDAWIFSGGQTIQIGLNGGIYLNPNGDSSSNGSLENQSSTPYLINDNGQVAGVSTKYDVTGGNAAWVYDSGTGLTTAVGLTGYSNSIITSSNKINNVVVSGTSTLGAGTTAFLYNFASKASTAVSLDVTQPAVNSNGTLSYTGSSNTTFSSGITAINNSGQAIGSQQLYLTSNGTLAGSDAFFFNGTTTVSIGLTDAAHTAIPAAAVVGLHSTSYSGRSNTASFLNDAGQVVGTATQYDQTTAANGTISSTSIGTNAWVYNAAIGTHVIGLTSSLYTNPLTGGQSSSLPFSAPAQNASGLVAGTSTRYYANGTTAGSDAFLYKPGANGTFGTTSVIGLTDALHTSSDGINKGTTSVFGTDVLGLVAGTSQRFVSGSNTTNGQDAWVYNANSGTTYQITLSSNTTNYASSTVQYLGDNGLVLGSYNNYASNGTLLGTYAYAFEGGQAYDLGVNTTNFTAAGWTKLASTFSADTAGDIGGTGILSGTISNGNTTYTSLYVLAFNGLLGDANLDGKVDLTDLNIVLNNLGTTTSLRSNGNFDGAATIDLTDLNDVLNNLGTGLTTNVSVGSIAATPEPASLSVLALSGLLLARRRRPHVDCKLAHRSLK